MKKIVLDIAQEPFFTAIYLLLTAFMAGPIRGILENPARNDNVMALKVKIFSIFYEKWGKMWEKCEKAEKHDTEYRTQETEFR
jgi:hypothetical protein